MTFTTGQTVTLTRALGMAGITGTVMGRLSPVEQTLFMVESRQRHDWYWVALHRHGTEPNFSDQVRPGDWFHAAGLEAL